MAKDLPKVFKNKIDKELKNNSEFYYSANNSEHRNSEEVKQNSANSNDDIRKKINEIFMSPNYIYKATVSIKTKTETLETRIIGRNKNYLITMDNKTIPIDNIIDITKK